MSKRRAVAVLATSTLIAAIALVWAVPSGAATTAVDIRDFQFVAASVTVTAGGTVRWTESGQSTHSVTADDGSFDSSPSCPGTCLGHGSVFAHTFSTPGVYRYYCRIHGGRGGLGMSGTVTVVAADTTTTPTTAPTTTAPSRGAPTTTLAGTDPAAAPTPMASASPSPAVTADATLTG